MEVNYERRKWKVRLNDPKSGGKRNSMVMHPAMEDQGVFLSKDGSTTDSLIHLAVDKSNDLRQTITGALLIPNKWVEQRDRNTRKIYLASIDEEDIRNYAMNFSIVPERLLDTNLEHTIPIKGEKNAVPRLIESWIVEDSKIDKSALLGKSYPKGTYVATYYIPDKDLYNLVKEKGMGFSIEADFEEVPFTDNQEILNKPNTNTMKLSNLLSFFKLSKSYKLMDFTLKNGDILSIDDNTYQAKLKGEIPKDGEYTLSDGSIVAIQNGQLIDFIEATLSKDATDDKSKVIDNKEADNKQTDAKLSDAKSTTPNEVEDLKKKVEEISAQLSAITKEKEELNKKLTPLETTNAALAKEVERLKSTPPAPTNFAPVASSIDPSKMTYAQKMTHNAMEYQRKLAGQ